MMLEEKVGLLITLHLHFGFITQFISYNIYLSSVFLMELFNQQK